MVRVDLAFLGANGLDLEEGLTTPNLLEAAMKRKMIRIAKQVTVLADHSKIGKVSYKWPALLMWIPLFWIRGYRKSLYLP
ncbi:putative aga operon transcriptional repressor [Paenibacillus larvae subsp. larvae]|uniref:Putative aga operon transcriptional repressor n=1 Tax=Paenibacillus larvae subsp. larvae TaxID=147375 RepID=A0A2L1TVY2_9BACL|nr:putative aga operon transcriptional repressor [Paenibacillus larvae subsp. larvae]AVF29607.1 putative aga operon transcriptional repressor [Paenibacillus larvae subsp. larvae]